MDHQELFKEEDHHKMFDILCAPSMLRCGFKAVRRNGGSPGIDGVTIEDFEDHLEQEILPDMPDYEETSNKASRRAWVRLNNKIYEVDPFVCPYCGSDMKVRAIIQDSKEIMKIMNLLARKKRAPPVSRQEAS